MNNVSSLGYFAGEFILLIGAVLVLFSDIVFRDRRWTAYLALAVTAAGTFFFRTPEVPVDLFYGFFRLDAFTSLFRYAAAAVLVLSILLSLSFKALKEENLGEYYALLLFTGFGLILMAASRNLLMIFLSIELVSIISYLLAGFLKHDARSKEAGLKYLLFGSACSGMMLYGMSLLYGFCGSLDLAAAGSVLSGQADPALGYLAFTLILAGIGFKISMAPFHMWAPDVYEGAPTPVTAFLTVGPKALGFAVLIRLLHDAFAGLSGHWAQVFSVLAVLTMTSANLTALAQTNMKRFLAYSSIAQAGYILVGLAAASGIGLEGVVFYLLTYLFTNLGVFAVVIAEAGGSENYEIDRYSGLARRSPFLAACLSVFLLSLAGIPPMAGFMAKFFVFAGAVESGRILLAAIAVVNSVISAWYYFRVIRLMYFVPSNEGVSPGIFLSRPLTLTLWAALAVTVFAGVFPTPLLSLVRASVSL